MDVFVLKWEVEC